jgi:hypothetical protein
MFTVLFATVFPTIARITVCINYDIDACTSRDRSKGIK